MSARSVCVVSPRVFKISFFAWLLRSLRKKDCHLTLVPENVKHRSLNSLTYICTFMLNICETIELFHVRQFKTNIKFPTDIKTGSAYTRTLLSILSTNTLELKGTPAFTWNVAPMLSKIDWARHLGRLHTNRYYLGLTRIPDIILENVDRKYLREEFYFFEHIDFLISCDSL